MCRSPTKLKHFYSLKCVLSEEDAVMCSSASKLLQFIDIQVTIDPIHKWRLFYFCSVIMQISVPSLALEQEYFSI